MLFRFVYWGKEKSYDETGDEKSVTSVPLNLFHEFTFSRFVCYAYLNAWKKENMNVLFTSPCSFMYICVYYNSKSELLGLISWQAIIYSDVIKSRIQSDDPTNPKYKGIQYENRKNIKRKKSGRFLTDLFLRHMFSIFFSLSDV
jgi:hypothetical protein